LMEIHQADALAQAPCAQEESLPRIAQMKEELQKVLSAEQCFSLKDLAVTGKDIMELGVPQGPMVGQILNYLLTMVMDDLIPNEKEPLLLYADKFWRSIPQN